MPRLPSGGATLVTGANGFLGGLVTAALLADERRPVVLPIRSTADPADCRRRLRAALLDYGVPDGEADGLLGLATIVELPALERFDDLDRVAADRQVEEIMHCAGCVDYFDAERLRLANVDLTARLLAAARRWGVRRFGYLSTAYCSGYRAGVIGERLHPDPPAADEPTAYTRSKRTAERLIADGGVPYLIVRPSIVIGDSRTGRYTGRNYGLYQMWRAIEGLLCREYAPVWHTVAPPTPVNLVHQDAFQSAFLGLYREAAGGVAHLVGDGGLTARNLCWLWADVYWPAEIRSYPRLDDVPLATLPVRQRRFLELAWTNVEISTRPWAFETRRMDALRAGGLPFAEATLETVARCQRRFIEAAPRIGEHMRRYAGRAGAPPRLIEMSAEPSLG